MGTLSPARPSELVFARRYFSKFDSMPLRPYIIFQIYAYKVYNRHGYLQQSTDSGLLLIDDSKVRLIDMDTVASWNIGNSVAIVHGTLPVCTCAHVWSACVCVRTSVCISVCACVSALSVSVCLSLALSVSLCLSLPLSVSL